MARRYPGDSMKKIVLLTAFLSLALAQGAAQSAGTADEAEQLGKTLTPIGAIAAGNKEGTIPAWTGGLTTPPPGYAPGNKPGPYVDPFQDEKPVLRITGKNYEQYADKLSES